MIEQNVVVMQCLQEQILVRLGGQNGCSVCDAGHGCGAGVFARLLQRKPVTLELARGDLDVSPGQMVTLAYPEKVYLKLVLVYYAWPLLAALTAALWVNAVVVDMQAAVLTLDMITLLTALTVGGLVLRILNKRATAGRLLKSLELTVSNISASPATCSRQHERHKQQ